MTDNEAETQWYIARDGEQHGPLTDAEMRAFIEYRHLRSTDLVWRPGFVDWRPAPLIFPMQAHEIPLVDPHALAPTRLEDDFASFARETAAAASAARMAENSWVTAARRRFAEAKSAARARFVRPKDDTLADRRFKRTRRAVSRAALQKAVAIAAVTCFVLAGAGLLFANRATVLRMAGLDGRSANVGATSSIAATASPEAIDDRLQKVPLWVTIKKEFPDWYGDLTRRVARLPDDDQAGATLSKHLAEALVALRRQNANVALAASSPRLVEIAQAFLENLKALKALGGDACYAFISQGEASPATIQLFEDVENGRAVQNQVTAIVAAIAEGRASPVSHEKPSKADYDTLASGLTKLGWSEDDLKLFANPRALARSTPEKVCQMVHDWFEAHIAIKDASTQERLLVETLRPVIAG